MDPTLPARFASLDAAFDRAMAPLRSCPEPLSLLFSGGVDSSLLAHELRGRPDLELVAIGRPGSPDLFQAAEAARRLGRVARLHAIDDAAIARAASAVRVAREPRSRGTLAIAVAFALAVDRTSHPTVVTGQGADELFLGYRHFVGLAPAPAERRAEEDLSRLLRDDWPRAVHLASRAGRRLVAPYLDPAWVAAARAIPIAVRSPSPDGERKGLFRAWARHRGLDAGLAATPKRAFQYGSRIQSTVDRLVRAPAEPPPQTG
ncbi:MAG: asparagine synthase C-terminal domain-containing protein [Thermoplasmata archaeon]